MIHSIKYRLIKWFISFSLALVLIVVLLNSNYNQNREENSRLIEQISNLENNLQKVLINNYAFFSIERTNPTFFESGYSKYIEMNDSSIRRVIDNLDELQRNSVSQNIDIKEDADSIRLLIDNFSRTFHQIVILIRERGYKDYGLEGEMRDYIHKLEELSYVDQTAMLMLRRHEKDYIIRGEEQYVRKLHNKAAEFKSSVKESALIRSNQKNEVVLIIENYEKLFDKIVALDRLIGIRENSNLKKQLDTLSVGLETQIKQLISIVEDKQKLLLNQARLTYVLEIILAILLSLFVCLFITKKITTPIILLTNYISNLTRTDFTHLKEIFDKKPDIEVLTLYNEFNKMLSHVANREQQRDQAIAGLKILESRFRHMADLLPVCLFETDHWGRFVYINKQFKEKFGYQTTDWCNLSLLNIIEDKVLFENFGRQKNLNGYETIAVNKDQKHFPIMMYCSERMDDGLEIGIRGIIVDISDRAKIIEDLKNAKQKAEESDRLKSSFLANMSHEIRTPMTGIIGFSDLLTEHLVNDQTGQEYLAQIQSSSNHLLNIINDIIDISIIDAGKIFIRNERFEVNPFLEEIYLHFLNGGLNKKEEKIEFKLEKYTKDHLFINSDAYRLKQVVINLVSNAIKFTHKGSVTLGYHVEHESVSFYVEDTGIGIPRDKLGIIFERFRQADETLHRKYGGTGLGLAISKSIVKAMGGQMKTYSDEGKGSIFSFNIPCKNIEIQKTSEYTEKRYAQRVLYNWETKTVLVIEDDELSRFFLEEALKSTNINVIVAKDGLEGIELFRNNKIDIVLMDMNMPVIDGFIATPKIKEINSVVPVIAQTACAMPADKSNCMVAGCDDYITKPINKEELFFKMDNLMGNGILSRTHDVRHMQATILSVV